MEKQLSLVEHYVWDVVVAGSNPVFFTIYWGGSSPGQSACLARRRQRVRLPSSPPLWRCSSAGQSIRFIPGRSRVRLPLAPPNLEFHIHYRRMDLQLSWLEHPAHNRQVAGSSPAGSTNQGNYPSLAEGTSLENQQGLYRPRGFESLIARHLKVTS